MIDEMDLSQEKAFYGRQRALKVIENLQKRNMNGYFAQNRQEALSIAMGLIPPQVLVARGDSMSVDQIGLLAEIIKRNQNKIIDPFEVDAEGHWPEDSIRADDAGNLFCGCFDCWNQCYHSGRQAG